jgi:hypothetical protein
MRIVDRAGRVITSPDRNPHYLVSLSIEVVPAPGTSKPMPLMFDFANHLLKSFYFALVAFSFRALPYRHAAQLITWCAGKVKEF